MYFLRVGDLAKGMMVMPPEKVPTRCWKLYPYHVPLPKCYAHTTICSCEESAPHVPVKPPPSVRDQFRGWLWENLQPCELPEPPCADEADPSA